MQGPLVGDLPYAVVVAAKSMEDGFCRSDAVADGMGSEAAYVMDGEDAVRDAVLAADAKDNHDRDTGRVVSAMATVASRNLVVSGKDTAAAVVWGHLRSVHRSSRAQFLRWKDLAANHGLVSQDTCLLQEQCV